MKNNSIKRFFNYLNPFEIFRVKLIYRYIFKSLIPYIFIGVAIFSFVNLIQYLISFIELSVQYGASITSVLKTVFYLIPFLMTFTIPIGLFLGIILALARMSHHSEIIALKSSGVNFFSICKPCIAMGIIVFIFQLFFFEWILPWGNKNFIISRYNIMQEDPMAEIKKKKYFKDENREIYVGHSDDKQIYDVMINDKSKNKLYYSNKAEVVTYSKYKTNFVIKLQDVSVVPYIEGGVDDEYALEHYKNLDFVIKTASVSSLIPDGAETDKISILRKRLKHLIISNIMGSMNKYHIYVKSKAGVENLSLKLKAAQSSESKKYLLESLVRQRVINDVAKISFKRAESVIEPKEELFIFHRKIAFSMNSIIMALIAVPLAIFKQRKNREVSILGSVIIIVLYNIMLVGIQIIYQDIPLSPVYSAWLPTIILFILCIILYNIKLKAS